MAKKYQNYMEQVVERAIKEYLKNEEGICACEQCVTDMAAMALNQLKPHYATTMRGAAYLESEQKNLDFVVRVVSAVKSAAEKVGRAPRHAPVKK